MKHPPINIFIVDDELLFASLLRVMLNQHNICTTAIACNGQEALALLKKKKPHLVLLDLEMPILNGSKTLNNIQQRFPDLKVIIVSSYHDEELIKDCLNRGAKGFVSKRESKEVLVEAIESVYRFGSYQLNLQKLFKNPSIKDRHCFKLMFTKMELEIISRLCEGKTNDAIAAELFISDKTVQGHLTGIYKKVKVKTRTEFLKYALESGLQFLGNPLISR